MSFTFALLAALGCAICNGTAAILQKLGADEQAQAVSLNPGILLRLMHNVPYVTGVALDLTGWGLTLIAVHSLPLFLVQSVIAASILVTALGEQLLTRRFFDKKIYFALLLVVAGLVLLGLAAKSEQSDPISSTVRLVIAVTPIPLAIMGVVVARVKHRLSALALAALSGLAFGGTSIVGRILTYGHSLNYYLTSPLLWALLAYGFLGILLFTIALQRTLATKVNAVMLAVNTSIPALIGLTLFGDEVKQGWEPALVIGIALTLTGCLITALTGRLTSLTKR